ncbi:hypothetical protein BGX33_009735 [Mortierella sp. NVP41]|nr:hypothetical protein BGX33_009735 [Mortierella sp. NVP41]
MDPSNLHIPNTTVTAQSNDNLDKEMREKALEMLRAINGLNTQHIAATTDPVHAEALKATLPKLDNLTFKFLSTFTSPEAAVFAMSTAQASEYSDLMDYISSAPDLPLPAVVDLSTTSLMATTSSISPGATLIDTSPSCSHYGLGILNSIQILITTAHD